MKFRESFKNIVPNWAKTIVRKSLEFAQNAVIYRKDGTTCRNFIVTGHKCGSQWFKTIFGSKSMHKICEYRYYAFKLLPLRGFDTRKLTERPTEIFNLRPGIYGPIYVSPSCLLGFSGRDNACVVIRDPRNLIISWYESILKTHALMGNVGQLRSKLNSVSKIDGVDIMIDHAINFGTFEALEAWLAESETNERIKVIKFEELFSSNQKTVFESILQHFQLNYQPDKVDSVLQEFSFKELSRKNNHYKQGKARTWENELSANQLMRISDLCPKLIAQYS